MLPDLNTDNLIHHFFGDIFFTNIIGQHSDYQHQLKNYLHETNALFLFDLFFSCLGTKTTAKLFLTTEL